MTDKTTSCPECGCKEFNNENLVGEGYRVCDKCGQEWWADIDYSRSCDKCDSTGGVATVACCCGHGEQDGRIDLADGRVLVIKAHE